MPASRYGYALAHPSTRTSNWTTPRARNFVLSLSLFAIIATFSTLLIFLSFPSTAPIELLRKLANHSGQGRAFFTRPAFCAQFTLASPLATVFPYPPNSPRRPSLTGTDLLDNALNHSLYIHQSWKSSSIPPRFESWSESWQQWNPTLQHVLWTDEENERLVRERYSEYWELYMGFGPGIKRVDFVRNLYMHQ